MIKTSPLPLALGVFGVLGTAAVVLALYGARGSLVADGVAADTSGRHLARPSFDSAVRVGEQRAAGASMLITVADVRSATGTPAAVREIQWDELVPKDWDPRKEFKEGNVGRINDADPRAGDMMLRLRAAWDNAPTVPAMDGVAVKLPGYIVPLEEANGELKEFLLVPYFGACIHTPPPPANQIVLVRVAKGGKGFRAMDTVWVSGTLRATRQSSAMGTSGYRMENSSVERYVAPPR